MCRRIVAVMRAAYGFTRSLRGRLRLPFPAAQVARWSGIRSPASGAAKGVGRPSDQQICNHLRQAHGISDRGHECSSRRGSRTGLCRQGVVASVDRYEDLLRSCTAGKARLPTPWPGPGEQFSREAHEPCQRRTGPGPRSPPSPNAACGARSRSSHCGPGWNEGDVVDAEDDLDRRRHPEAMHTLGRAKTPCGHQSIGRGAYSSRLAVSPRIASNDWNTL